jgi:hypothetical protein
MTTPARSTSEIKLRWIPNNVNNEQGVHLRNRKSEGSPIPISTTVHFRNQNLIKTQTTNHKITKRGPPQKPESDGPRQPHPNVHLVHLRNKTSDGSEQDMNQTQVFFPGSDYTSYKTIGGKSQILTARILRRRKSRRRNGKP